jgi:hypothetical protein
MEILEVVVLCVAGYLLFWYPFGVWPQHKVVYVPEANFLFKMWRANIYSSLGSWRDFTEDQIKVLMEFPQQLFFSTDVSGWINVENVEKRLLELVERMEAAGISALVNPHVWENKPNFQNVSHDYRGRVPGKSYSVMGRFWSDDVCLFWFPLARLHMVKIETESGIGWVAT